MKMVRKWFLKSEFQFHFKIIIQNVKSAENIIVKINLQEIYFDIKKEESLNKLCDTNCFPQYLIGRQAYYG